jgi:hypothetical protein
MASELDVVSCFLQSTAKVNVLPCWLFCSNKKSHKTLKIYCLFIQSFANVRRSAKNEFTMHVFRVLYFHFSIVIALAERSKVYDWSRSIARIAGSSPGEGRYVRLLCLMCVV